MGLIEQLRLGARKPPPPDPASMRFEMSQTDPEFAHVRKVQHEALGLIGASRSARQLARRVLDGRSIRHEVSFWEQYGRQDG